MQLLMCPPTYYGIEYEINPWMSRSRQSDRPLAIEQWHRLHKVLSDELGIEIHLVDPQPGLPDMVFTANAGVVWDDKFILSNFRYEVRRPEAPHYELFFRNRGFEIVRLPERYFFEGEGDLLKCGELWFGGYHIRSDMLAHQKIAESLESEILSLELTDDWFYHLDTCFCPLAEGQALFYPRAFDSYARTVLETHIPGLIPVAPEEAARFACNAIVAGKHVVMNEGCPKVRETLERLIEAGTDSLPGGGAEIFCDRVRRIICDHKITGEQWLEVARTAHKLGLKSNCTMLYGHIENDEDRVDHLLKLRDLQDETGGFTAFITWSFQPEHTERGGLEATGIDYLRTLALARIVLDNFDNLQASWVTQGGKVGQLSLAYGANDMGSVMIEENVVRAAGAAYCMDEIEIVRNVEDAGFSARRRNMHYAILGEPIFRERAVPRMRSLATARADGAAGEAADVKAYPARSREGKHRRSMG